MSHATRLAAASRMVAALGDAGDAVNVTTYGHSAVIAVDIDPTASADDTITALTLLLAHCDEHRTEAQEGGRIILARAEGSFDVVVTRGYALQVVPS